MTYRALVSLAVSVALGLSSGAVGVFAASWEPVGLSGGGGMFSPAISPADPDLMMVNCDMSAAYISEDGGHNWRMINHAQLRSDTRCRPGFHPSKREVIYASSGGALRVSQDRGHTFVPIGNLKSSLQGEIAINPANPEMMLVGTGGGPIQISRDAGVTWTPCAGPEGRVIGFHFDRTRPSQVMFAGTDQGIWRSDDGGRIWAKKTTGLPWNEVQGFAGGSDQAKDLVMLYCAVKSKDEGGVFKGGIYCSRDRGETWQWAMGQGINMETKKADEWAYGAVAQYHQILATDAKPLTVYAMNTGTGFHPPHHETVYRSDDGGGTWRATYFQDPRFERYNVAPDYVTASTGQSFKGGDTPFGVAICSSDPDRLMLVMNEPHITHDGGATWFVGSTYPAPGQKPKPGSAWVCNGLVVTTTWNYYIDPFEANRHYIAYTDIGFARSIDSGKTWIWWDQKSWAPWRNTCYQIAFDPTTPGKMWGAFSDVHDIPNDNIISERHGHNRPGGVCVSADFGASWRPDAKGIPPRPVTSIVLDPKSPKDHRTLYAGVFMEGVYKSTDDGNTWTLKKTGLGHPTNVRVSRVILHADGTLFALVCAMRPGPGKPLAGEGVGLYRSKDGAETWEQINSAQPLLYPKDFEVHPTDSNTLLLGACDSGRQDQSGGLYRTRDGGRTWQRIGRQAAQTFGGYFHPKHDGWIYMTLTEGAPGAGLWLSRDDGRTWEPFEDLPFSNIQRVVFAPSNDSVMYVTTFGGSVWRGPIVPRAEKILHFYGETDKNPLSYKAGEEMVFTIQLLDNGKPVAGKTLQWQRQGDDGLASDGKVVSGEQPLVVKSSTEQAGFVRVTVKAFEPDGKAIDILPFQGSAAVGWQALQGLPEPGDFDAFWAKQKTKLASVPISAELVPVQVPGDDAHEFFDVTIPCVGKPVSGYYCRPKHAAAKSLPIKIAFIGYNWNSAIVPTWANDFLAVDPHIPIGWAENPDRLKNCLTLNINAHGYKNGQPRAYYDELARTTLRNYGFSKEENENPETSYFLGMCLRLIRAMEWTKQQPEWDGKTLVVSGGSQGGFQALAAAGLDSDVSECYAYIPWMCNIGTERQGRIRGTFFPEYADALRYFDSANHAKRIKGKVLIDAGLGDFVCPPCSQAVLYNGIKSPKKIIFHQGMQHPHVMPDGKSYTFSAGR